MNTVARELSGGIMAVTRDSSAKPAGIGQKIEFPIVPDAGLRDVKPSTVSPNVNGEEIKSRVLEITKSKAGDIVWTGNEQESLGDEMYQSILQDQITERMRAIVNEVEADIMAVAVAEAKDKLSVADPFSTDLKALTQVYKTLQDKGAPRSSLQGVLNTTASMNLRNLNQLQKVNEAGTPSLLRQGVLGNLMGFDIRETCAMPQSEADSSGGNDYLVNGNAKKGDYVIHIDTGTKVINKGASVSFGSDYKYAVADDVASGSTELHLVSPLQEDVADNTTVTVTNNVANTCVFFPRSAIWLATRTIPEPQGGDMAVARRTITDPQTGLSFGVSLYPGYKQNHIEISMSWGVGIVKPEFVIPVIG